MAKPSYYELLKDPRWQRRRLEIMDRDGFACRHCQDKESPLNVHHAYYTKGAMPWEYPDLVLITLCESCHKQAETDRQELLLFLGQLAGDDCKVLIGFARGLLMARSPSVKIPIDDKWKFYGEAIRFLAMANRETEKDTLFMRALVDSLEDRSLITGNDFYKAMREAGCIT